MVGGAGRYVVESMLGTGGMGSVLRAQHVELDQPVAIKVMHRSLLVMPDAVRRFLLEGHATSKLKSQHAVRIFEIDTLPSGTPFIVMELLEGIDLGTMIASRGPLPLDRAILYLLQATDAIAEAHTHGIIHRDIKPRNLFLTKDGIVKVVDFGLAKSLKAIDGAPPLSTRTAQNLLLGSPSFMSPEQILPGRSVDERTDIWCLGATLFQLLTNEPPFPAQNLYAMMTRITKDEPARVIDKRPELSPRIDAVIGQCLRKDPNDRFSSIAALQTSLLHLRAELMLGARDVSASIHANATIPATTRRGSGGDAYLLDTGKIEIPPNPPFVPASAPTERDLEAAQPVPRSWGDDEPTQISLNDSSNDADGDLRDTRKLRPYKDEK